MPKITAELQVRGIGGGCGDAPAPASPPAIAQVKAYTAHLEARGVGVHEAARLLGIGRTKVFMLIAKGAIRSVKIGARRIVPMTEIDRVLAYGCLPTVHRGGKPRRVVVDEVPPAEVVQALPTDAPAPPRRKLGRPRKEQTQPAKRVASLPSGLARRPRRAGGKPRKWSST